ncbi:carbon-nitrogen hydrolase family protein [Bacillaceae bacterium SAOS 7]|nr:carbon-nitrogen hydrolase family protein [Bacillaceae bacterium SAOS 7]
MRLAFAQIETIVNNKRYNLDKVIDYLHTAKKDKADIALFPELVLTGYSIGPWLRETAETLDGPSVYTIQKVCKQLNISTIFSFPEFEKGNYFVTSAFINEHGNLVGIYRKTHLYDEEKIYFSRGDKFPLFETSYGSIGIMSSFDLEFPEVARILCMKGADLILIPTTNMYPYREYQQIYIQSRAMENEVPFALCNRIGPEGKLTFIGGSTFVDARGITHFLLNEEEKLITIPVLLFKNANPKSKLALNRNPDLIKKLY